MYMGKHEQSAADTYTSVVDGVSVLGSQSLSLSSTKSWVDYVYLDTDERRRFAKVAHEYLIETLQYNGGETVSSTNPQVKLNFTHPVKNLFGLFNLQTLQKIRLYTNPYGNQPLILQTFGIIVDLMEPLNLRMVLGCQEVEFHIIYMKCFHSSSC